MIRLLAAGVLATLALGVGASAGFRDAAEPRFGFLVEWALPASGDATVTLAYVRRADERPLARLTILVPATVRLPTSGAAGRTIGFAFWRGLVAIAFGDILIGELSRYAALAVACTGRDDHDAVWVFDQAPPARETPLAGVAAFVDGRQVDVCLPTAQGAVFDELGLTFDTRGRPARRGRWISVAVPDVGTASRTEVLDRHPVRLLAAAKRVSPARVRLRGRLTAAGRPLSGARIQVLLRRGSADVARTDRQGRFTTVYRTSLSSIVLRGNWQGAGAASVAIVSRRIRISRFTAP
jgi:hypothetical protein